MPRSKLRSSMSIGEIDSIHATREKIDIETVTVNNRIVKRPKFLQAQISPSFRDVGSVETDEVEYDSYVKWAITKAVQPVMWPPWCVSPTTTPLPCSSSESPSDIYNAEPYTYNNLDGYLMAPGGYMQFGSQDSLVYTDEIWFWAIGCPDDKIVVEVYIVDFQATSTDESYMNGDWIMIDKYFAFGGTRGWFTIKAPSSNGYAVFVHCIHSGGVV